MDKLSTSEPRPFLRWAGSKRSLLRDIIPTLPSKFGRYYEPFFGGGSLFFLLCPKRATLSDTCRDLIDTLEAVRDNVSSVIRYVRPMCPDREFFYALRKKRSRGKFKRAAEFIYMNKVCWNGLYRVNSSGQFNVPYGRPKSANIADFSNLRSCSELLSHKRLRLAKCDFSIALENVAPGDLVYLDPPYVTKHNNNGFVDYNETLFSWSDQIRLAELAAKLVRQRVHVIVSNADHGELRNLYRGFRSRTLRRSSTLASDRSARGRVSEVLFYPRSK